jgi:hypothetical protein
LRELDGTIKTTRYPGERLKKFIHRHEPRKDLFLNSNEEGSDEEDEYDIVVELDESSDIDNDVDYSVGGYSHQLMPLLSAKFPQMGGRSQDLSCFQSTRDADYAARH